jgi:mannose-6-phosphate isomerase-like protein (cupin superfamily)
MIELGRTYRHPRNGAELTVLRDEPAGYELEIAQPPGIGRSRPHVHLDFEQEFEVLEGVAQLKVGRERRTVPAGERVHVPRGTVHVDPFNEGPERLVFRNRIAPNPPFIPAFVAAIVSDLSAGRLADSGDLPLLRFAVVQQATDGQSWGPGPLAPQRALMPLLAAVGRRRGHASGRR